MADTPRMGSSNLATLWAKLKSYFVKGNTGVFYGTCATAAATAAKVVTCADFASGDLKPGAMIFVQFDITNSAAIADLTLNVNSTGAKHIKQVRNNSLYNIPGASYLIADRTYPFYYDGTYWCLILTYDSNDYNYRLRTRYYGALVKSLTACGRYLLLLSVSDNEVVPVNAVNNSTATSKTLTTQSFDPFRPIFFYSATTVISANGYFGNGYIYEAYDLIDLRYSFNTGSTLTAKKPVFIVCAPKSDGLVKLHSAPISQSLPTTEDGLYYIYLGLAYDTYRIDLELNKPVYQFKNGRVREVVDDARTVTGHTVARDLPLSARLTDTTYEAEYETIGSASAGTAISADDITKWTANTPTSVTKKTVVTGGSKTSIPNISKKTVVTGVTKKTVVTGGSKTSIPNISKKTVVTGVTKKTVVTGGSKTSIPNISKKTVVTGVTKKTVVTSASGATATYADGIVTITDGSFSTGDSVTVSTGDSVTVGTAIEAYTSLTTGDSVDVTTGDSVTVGTAIEAYTSLTTGDSVDVTTGDSVTVGTPIEAYTSLTTGDSVSVTAGTAATLEYTSRSIPNISVTNKDVMSGIHSTDGILVNHAGGWFQNATYNENASAGADYETVVPWNANGTRVASPLIPISHFPISISHASGFAMSVLGFDADGKYLGSAKGQLVGSWNSDLLASIDESEASQICILLKRTSGSLDAHDISEAELIIDVQAL